MNQKQIFNILNKFKFLARFDPIVEKSKKYRQFIPEPYKSALLISADFELAWAWRYTKSSANPLEKALVKARQERVNIPVILNLLEKFNIRVTWFTVGHLFLESCFREQKMAHAHLPRLNHFENNFWKFIGKDWYEHDPCTNIKDDPEWYAPDLIKLIQESKVKNEIGCHTFSHIDCRDGICSPDLIRAELRECKKMANKWGLNLKSFVHPGHTIGNLDVLAEEGFTNFRTDYRNVLSYPKKHQNGLWEFEQTAEFVYKKEWSIDYHIYRYITILKRAIQSNTVCVFWFHPSFDPMVLEKILPEVFKFLNDNRNKIWITTHNDYIQWLSIF